MGKFDGVLIVSDYDNTMAYTEGSLRTGTPPPPVSPGNREAVEYFMAQGGIFSVATGRALPSFAKVQSGVPMNGPTILFNGAAIYDFSVGRYLHTAFLPEEIRSHIRQILQDMPDLAMEIYHDDNSIHALNPNDITRSHEHLTHSPTVTLNSIDEAPSPIAKIMFEEWQPKLGQILEYIQHQSWGSLYECVLSASFLLEVTVKGANKGGMTEKLAQLLGIERRHVYAMGDHANDIPMLQFAHGAFAPQNAIESVHAVPGIHILPNCWEDATAAMIAQIDKLY